MQPDDDPAAQIGHDRARDGGHETDDAPGDGGDRRQLRGGIAPAEPGRQRNCREHQAEHHADEPRDVGGLLIEVVDGVDLSVDHAFEPVDGVRARRRAVGVVAAVTHPAMGSSCRS